MSPSLPTTTSAAFERAIERTAEQVNALGKNGQPPKHLQALATSTVGRCLLGLAGFVEYGLAQMKQFVCTINPTETQVEDMYECLLLFALVVSDEDNAIFAAHIGTHPYLLRLMEHDDDLIQDAAAQVIASCTTNQLTRSGISFPFRSLPLDKAERVKPFAISLPTDARDANDSDATLSVLIRQVPTRMTGQPKTGYLLWGAAIVMARWIHLHRDLFSAKTVLEVGSGLGLGGIVAARYAACTVLTDYQDDTCRALEYNVSLNREFTHGVDPARPDVAVQHLDWDNLESINGPSDAPLGKVDVIIGSDIICEPCTADGFLRVVRNRLSTHGVAYLMNADAHSRFGVSYLHTQLAASNLVYTITKVQNLPDGQDLLATVPDVEELKYEYYEIRLPSTVS